MRSHVFGLVALAACGSNQATPDGGSGSASWQVEANELEAAVLCIFALDSEGEQLIAAGGPLRGDGPPSLFRRDSNGRWNPLPVPTATGAIWWGFAATPNDVWVVGAAGTVLEGPLDALSPVQLPAIDTATRATFFGVWGADRDDIWIVGGSPNDPLGPQGLILRWRGRALERVQLTGTASIALDRTLFKVWGRSAQDVTIVGERGIVLHYDGFELKHVPSDTNDRLLTVHGRGAGPVYAVGGFSQGTVLRIDRTAVDHIEAPGLPLINGVFVADDGAPWIGGGNGFLARWNGQTYVEVDTRLIDRDFHVVFVAPSGVFAAGGRLAVEEGSRRGVIGRFGP